MLKVFGRILCLSSWLFVSGAWADTLALPDALVDLRSPRGEAFLLESRALAAYFPIAPLSRRRRLRPIAA